MGCALTECNYAECMDCWHARFATNSAGFLASKQGGRWYCGAANVSYYNGCSTCDGVCGPASGCACGPCHELNEASGFAEDGTSCAAGRRSLAQAVEALSQKAADVRLHEHPLKLRSGEERLCNECGVSDPTSIFRSCAPCDYDV